MEQIYMYNDKEENVFQSDCLVYKTKMLPSRVVKEVLLVSVYGYPSDLRKHFAKNSGRITFMHKKQTFEISDLEDYHVEETKANEYLRIVLKRKTDLIIKDEEAEKENPSTQSYPLLFLTAANTGTQKETVYNMVKNGITTPMFPNVSEDLILAGQLFVSKKEAATIRETAKKGVRGKIDVSLYKRATFLLEEFENWKEYLFQTMVAKKLIRPVAVAYSSFPVQVFEIIIDEKQIEQAISEGVQERKIVITNRKFYTDEITDFNRYTQHFSPVMTHRIESQAKPLHRKGDIRDSTLYWMKFLGREPLTAQKDTIEASLKSMELQKKVNVVGECGVGKTFVMASTQWIHARMNNMTLKLLVLCPDTLTDTVWREELEKSIPGIRVLKISSISELQQYEKAGYLDDKEDTAFILSQMNAKTGYSLKPAVNWSKAKEAFVCPCCGKPVMEKVTNPEKGPNQPKFIIKPAEFDHFNSKRHNNWKCKSCDTVLWEALNKESAYQHHTFVYDKKMKGFYPKDTKVVAEKIAELKYKKSECKDALRKKRYEKEIEKLEHLLKTIKGKEKEGKKVSIRRVSIAEYIFKKMRGRFNHLIIDEIHEFQGDSARSDACSQLINSIPYIQTGTGTAMNGYAYSRFKTDYMLYPEKMKKAGFAITDKEKYQATFGVVEKRYRLTEGTNGTKKDTLSPLPKPGISPVIFPLFMQDTTVFLNLADLKENLPTLQHYQIEVEMDTELKEEKEKLEAEIREQAQYDKKLFRASIQAGYSFLDMPTIKRQLCDKETGEVLIETPVLPKHTDRKLEALLELARHEVFELERKMMVYTYYTGDKINEYLYAGLQREGLRVTVLNRQEEYSYSCDGEKQKVLKEDREKFIREEVKKGTDILIVNPELIKTGYNLIDFPTICYYQMGYQVYTNRQADRRSWRIGQTQDCKIIYLYYKDSIQQDIAGLMATKIVASQAIEGNMDAAGLEAICSSRTAEEELAKKFFEGIRDKVDLGQYKQESA